MLKVEVRADEGEGPVVLYVPGIDGSGDLLLRTADRIAERFRLVRLCYPPGEGGADAEDSYAGLARQMQRLCADLGIERCLVLAESFGGGVALQLALDDPDLVRGLMIINSFARFPQRAQLRLSRLLAPLLPRIAFDLGRRWLAPRNLLGSHRDPEVLRDFRALDGVFFDRSYRLRLRMIASLDLRARLGEIRQPTALFVGDEDRIVPSGHTMSELERGLPDATLEVVAGGGHLILPLRDQPWVQRLETLARRAGL